MATASETWTKLVSHALHTRLPAAKLSAFASRLAQQHPLQPGRIADLLLRPQKDSRWSLDSLVPLYIVTLLQNGELIDAAAVLGALLKYSTIRRVGERAITDGKIGLEAEEGSERVKWAHSFVEDEAVLYTIAKEISRGARPTRREEAMGILGVLIEWIGALGTGAEMIELGEGQENLQETMAVRVAVGAVLVATVENEKVAEALRKACPKGNSTHYRHIWRSHVLISTKALLKKFSLALGTFTPTLLQPSPLIAERLELFRTQTLVPLEPVEKKTQVVSDEIDQMIDSALNVESIPVVDLPIINSRAGLYIYLNSLVTSNHQSSEI